MQSRLPLWWLVLAPLLLAALLSSIQLDDNAFNRDEPDSLYAAGIYSSGPGTLAEVWTFIEETDPHQTQGWSKLLFVWGRIVGWSEPAIRSLSFLACLLALACIYRAGRDLISPQVGLTASLLVSASVFFLAYGAIARAFALVELFATLAIFLAGCVGMLYSRFFTALILPALVLFHLLFAPSGKRWWQVIAAMAVAAVLALAQVPGLLNGLRLSTANEELARAALDAAEIPHHFLYYMSNLTLRVPGPAGAALLLLLLLALVRTTWRRRQ